MHGAHARLAVMVAWIALSSLSSLSACGREAPEIDLEPATDAAAPAPSASASASERETPRWEQRHESAAALDERVALVRAHPRSECEPGERRACPILPIAPGMPTPVPPAMHCRLTPSGRYVFDVSDCATPLVVAFDDAPVRFTRPAGDFAIGAYARTDWVSAATPWLSLDADGSGCVEDASELFGPTDGAANGFEALARFDDDHGGTIDANDAAFSRFALWYDRDQDRACTSDEMVSLAAAGIVAIDLHSEVESEPRLAGSHEGERAGLVLRDATGRLRRGRVVDVYLAPR